MRPAAKRCRDDLDRGVAEANATVSGYLFASAKAGNVTAQIFWLKTRAHWREKTAPEDRIPDAESKSEVLVLPDNNRDPELTQGCCATPKRNTSPENRSGSLPKSGLDWKGNPWRSTTPSGLSPIAVVTRFLATRNRRPRGRACDACRYRSQQRSRRSPDRRPSFCEPRLTSAYTAARQA